MKSKICDAGCAQRSLERGSPVLPWCPIVAEKDGTLRKAEKLIVACEGCSPKDAEIPFDHVLDRVTGNDPSVTDYIFEEPAKCPACTRPVNEKTLVECGE